MKKIIIVKFLFAIIGLSMLVAAFFSYQNTNNFLETAVTANGTVIELLPSRSSDSTTYAPVVEFISAEGVTIIFTSSTSSNPPSYSEGELVEVLYQSNLPSDAKINSFFSLWGAASILGGVGAVFFLTGTGMFVFGLLNKNKIKYLEENGIKITAKFQSVDLNENFDVNGKHPYRIIAKWTDPNTSIVHLFKSNNLWSDPSEYITSENITVLVERDNPKKYHVDTSFLP